MDHEKVAVVHWSSEKPGKCLECLAIKESVIMISIKRSYAWVIDDDANYFRTGWMYPHCTSLRKRYSLVLDVRSMRSLSPPEIRKLYSEKSGGEGETKKAASDMLPIRDPDAIDVSVFLE